MQKTLPETLFAANPGDAERWTALVSGSPARDVYYLPEYALATAEAERSEPLAVIAGSERCRFLAPLLVRRMSAVVKGTRTEWNDACSPYGYGGLLPLAGGQPGPYDLHAFFDDLQAWCAARDIVCCVLRLHPLMRQEKWFTQGEPGLPQVQLRGMTTAVGIEDWDRERDRPSDMRKGRRSDLNHARRTLRATWTSGEDREIESKLSHFFVLYHQSLERQGADTFYRFPFSYFLRLASLGPDFGLAIAWLDDRPVGASIFLAGRDHVHYHLAAANESGMKHGAATLLIAEGARRAKARGCRLLHLGGGLRAGDSLEDFKCSFGGQSYHYACLTYIADPERFEQLCRMPDAPWPYRANDKALASQE